MYYVDRLGSMHQMKIAARGCASDFVRPGDHGPILEGAIHRHEEWRAATDGAAVRCFADVRLNPAADSRPRRTIRTTLLSSITHLSRRVTIAVCSRNIRNE